MIKTRMTILKNKEFKPSNHLYKNLIQSSPYKSNLKTLRTTYSLGSLVHHQAYPKKANQNKNNATLSLSRDMTKTKHCCTYCFSVAVDVDAVKVG
jgi:hypothetical protein